MKQELNYFVKFKQLPTECITIINADTNIHFVVAHSTHTHSNGFNNQVNNCV